MAFIRLYLVPFNDQQQVLDVPDTALILSDGQFLPVQTAPSVTLVGVPVTEVFTPFDPTQIPQTVTNQQTQELRICWREPEEVSQYPDTDVIVVTDPTGGMCICGVTCLGPNISYAQVQNVTVEV
jgi:hypothetical protein